jgi:lysozyme family protein
MAVLPFTAALQSEYESLFNSCAINDGQLSAIESLVTPIQANRSRYESVGTPLGIPWYFIAAIHAMEASLSFRAHLHNGDPLTARTVNVPAGRPTTGQAPFSWEFSATDALTFDGFPKWTDWSLGGILYSLEKYNGFGYRSRGINTPYLWSYTNHYTSGKYVSDGKYDPAAVSKQPGAAAILYRMVARQIVTISGSTVSPVVGPATLVVYDPRTVDEQARQLQIELNTHSGIALTVDGVAGRSTSDAYKQVYGVYLPGDPRATEL